MKNLKYIIYSLALIASLGLFSSCDDDAPDQIIAAFTGPFGAGLTEGQSASFQVVLSKPVVNTSTVLLKLNSDAVYGTNYTTSPASFVAGELRLEIPAGGTSASFSIATIDDGNFSNGYQVEVTIDEITGDLFSTVGASLVLEVADPPTAIYNLDDCSSSIPSPFFNVNESGSNPFEWGCTTFGQSGNGLQYNSFSSGSTDPSDSWLMLNINDIPKSTGGNIDNASLSTFTMDVFVFSQFGGAGELTFWYSKDYTGSGDPSAATWVEIPEFAAQVPDGGSRIWQEISVDASAVTGSATGYVAIRHTGGVGGSSVSWQLDDISIFAGE